MSGVSHASRLVRLCRTPAVTLLVAVFLCVPVLSRLHRRLTSIDRGTGYRYSRSVAVPVERYTLVPAPAPPAAWAPARPAVPHERIVPLDRRQPACLFVLPATGVRAPPGVDPLSS